MNEDPKERKKKRKIVSPRVYTETQIYIFAREEKEKQKVHAKLERTPAETHISISCRKRCNALLHRQTSRDRTYPNLSSRLFLHLSLSLYLFYRKLFASIAHTHTSLALRLHFLEASRAPPSTHPRILPASLSLYHPGVRHFSVIAPRAIKRAACVYLAGGGFNDMHCPPARAHENISAREN